MKRKLCIVVLAAAALLLPALSAMAAEPDYTLEDGVLTVTGPSDFAGEIVLPASDMGPVDEIVIDCGAFYGSGVTALRLTAEKKIYIGGSASDFPDRDIPGAFEDCAGLTELELDAGEIEIDGYAFCGSGLERAALRCGGLVLGDRAFYGCGGLTDFECGAHSADLGGEVFSDGGDWLPWIKNRGDSVYLGDCLAAYSGSAHTIVTDCKKLAVDAFAYNDSLRNIVFSGSMTELPTAFIFDSPFRNMERLESVTLPSGLKHLYPCTFYGCTGLKTVILPEELETMFDVSFVDCPELETLTVPKGTEIFPLRIGNLAYGPFHNCGRLTLRVYEDTPAHEYVKGVGIPCEVIPKVDFADEKVEEAAKMALQRTGGIYEEDLAEVTELSLTGAASLEDIPLFPNLRSLKATYGWIDDLSPLADAAGLRELDLSYNRIMDVEPLRGLGGLESLNLTGNMIADAGPLNDIANGGALKRLLYYNYTGGRTDYIEMRETGAYLFLPVNGGVWCYGVYRDGELIMGGELTGESPVEDGRYWVSFEGLGDPASLTVKAFNWDSLSNLRPYELTGGWTFPVITSEHF